MAASEDCSIVPQLPFQPNIPYSDVELEQEPENLLGNGGFANVFRGRYKTLNATVAFKVLNGVGPGGLKKIVEKEFLQEAECMYRLSYKNVVHIYGLLVEPRQGLYSIVMEYMELGSVEDLRERIGDSLDWPLLLDMIAQACGALAWMHRSTCTGKGERTPYTGYHGDIKAANLLVNKRFTVKVSDFGLTRLQGITSKSTKQTAKGGTPTHVPPEIWNVTKSHSEKTDVWSFGVTMYEIAGGAPFGHLKTSHVPDYAIARYLCDQNGCPINIEEESVNSCPQSIKQLMSTCLYHNAESRPTFKEILGKIDAIWKEENYDNKYTDACIKAHTALGTPETTLDLDDTARRYESLHLSDVGIQDNPNVNGAKPPQERPVPAWSVPPSDPKDGEAEKGDDKDVIDAESSHAPIDDREAKNRREWRQALLDGLDPQRYTHRELRTLIHRLDSLESQVATVHLNINVTVQGGSAATPPEAAASGPEAAQADDQEPAQTDMSEEKVLTPLQRKLKDNWKTFMDDLTPEEVVSHLISDDVITMQQNESLNMSVDPRYKVVEKLLNILIRKPDEKLVCFRDALHETLQTHLAKLLE